MDQQSAIWPLCGARVCIVPTVRPVHQAEDKTKVMVVDRYSDSFNEHAESLRDRHEAMDRDDLNFAMSDVDVGRHRKHLPASEIDPYTGKKRNRMQEALQRTLDWLLLNDANYRLAHETLIKSVRSAQHETQSALSRVLDELAEARDVLDDLLSSAAKLPDGTRVFKDRNGKVRNEYGDVVTPELADTIKWRGDEPSYEEYKVQRLRIEKLEAAERELRGIETELGDIHERNTRNDDPQSIERLKSDTSRADELGRRVKEIEADLVSKTTNRLSQKETAAFEKTETNISQLSLIPDLGSVGKP